MSELPRLEEKIPALVSQAGPRRLLAVGSLARDLVAPGIADATELTTIPAAGAEKALAEKGHQDMAVIAGELNELTPHGAAQMLSQLRDLYAAWVIVVTDRDAPPAGLTRKDLVGLGFSLLGDAMHGDNPVHVYEFDMATYKTTPDWLNSRYWANPELWDKYRW
ncbi:hypothetical protein H0Z60_08870 [Ectothiorhodospiraceae bacterium WFHF3C12]|nr:hypothetical protein [Ectothiorhodospiraceae bacterium WFHF3C12]